MQDMIEEKFHDRTLLYESQLTSGRKETRRIPFRGPKSLPSMRTPPSGLFQVTQPKRLVPNPLTDEHSPSFFPSSSSESVSLDVAIRRPTPVRVPSNVAALLPTSYERQQREDLFSHQVGKGPSGLRAISIPTLVTPPPGIPLTAKRPLLPGRGEAAGLPTFHCVLAANKRKNLHAPSLVSRFNPLRDYVPPCAWISRRVPLISARFRTPLSSLPLRCRSDCDWATHDDRKTKENYLKRICLHCPGCSRDTLGKKLLVMNYLSRQVHHLLYGPLVPMGSPDDDDDPDAMEIDDDLLDSPLLRDLDDFDDVDDSADKQNALLPGAPGIEISHLSLF